MSQKHSDMIFDAVNDINAVKDRLNRIASAFSTTGNDKLANELWTYAHSLSKSADAIHGAVCERAHDEAEQSSQNSRNLLEAVLVGTTLGKRRGGTKEIGG